MTSHYKTLAPKIVKTPNMHFFLHDHRLLGIIWTLYSQLDNFPTMTLEPTSSQITCIIIPIRVNIVNYDCKFSTDYLCQARLGYTECRHVSADFVLSTALKTFCI